MTDDEIEFISIEEDDEPIKKFDGRRKSFIISDDDEPTKKFDGKRLTDSDDDDIIKTFNKKRKRPIDSDDDEPIKKCAEKKYKGCSDLDDELSMKPINKKRHEGLSDSDYEVKRLKKSRRKKDQPTRNRLINKVEPDEISCIPGKCGFDLGYKPEKIIGITDYGAGGLKFLIKFKDREDMELIESKKCHKHCPELVIQFYEQRIQWRNL